MLGMSEEISEMIKKILAIAIGPPVIFLILIVSSTILLFYKEPCKKCLVRACCSKKCDIFKKWYDFCDIIKDCKDMPIVVAAGACYTIAVGVLIYGYFMKVYI